MKIIGINAWHADASAALIIDGRVVAAMEEERFLRRKHWAGFPAQSIAFCLKEGGLDYESVDHFVIGRDPRAKFLKKISYLAKHPGFSIGAVKSRIQNRKEVRRLSTVLSNLSGLDERKLVSKIGYVEHHRSHLASAYFASPFLEAACLSIDGSGDFSTTMTAHASGNHIQVIDSVDFPHSLGLFYTAFTQLLGFPHYGDEYKVMGMAPYGQPLYKEEILKLIQLEENGLFRLDLSYFRKGTEGFISYDADNIPQVATLFSQQMVETFGPARQINEPILEKHKNLAASVQAATEEVIFHLLRHLHQKTNTTNLCIAGGVAQNSVANGKIKKNTPFKQVYIPSAGHDAGISMGAALFHYYQQVPSATRTHLNHAFLGTHYSNEEIRQLLNNKGLPFEETDKENLYNIVCDELISGGVAGWFSGRAEFGPRALGGRSILADPRRHDAKNILNEKIKKRESFRPFAPSVLKEYVQEYFLDPEEVPFMEKVLVIRPDKRNLIPAVTHVDGTGRLQTVDKSTAPAFYGLIEAFRAKTGIPILLNTSFNENEPIVNTPEDALNCFLRTKMDILVLENCLLRKNAMEKSNREVVASKIISESVNKNWQL